MFHNNTPNTPNVSEHKTKEDTELNKQREEITVNIRKEKREAEIMKRRKQNATAPEPLPQENRPLDPFEEKLKQFKSKTFDTSELQELAQCINSNDIEKAHYGMIGVRKILSSDKEPPIQLIIDSNLVPKMIEFAKQKQYPELQAEATWALSNVASGTALQTQSVVDKGGIQLFTELIKSSHELVVEQAVWAIGNIGGDRSVYRDSLIKGGALNTLNSLVMKCQNSKIVSQSAWAISNIVRLSPMPKYESIKQCIPAFASLFANPKVTDPSVISDCLWALSYMTEHSNSRLTAFMNTGVAPKIIEYLGCGVPEILTPSLRNLGNVCYGNEAHIQTLINLGLLHHLEVILNHKKKVIKREVCWTLSNIAASVPKHVETLFSQETLMNKLYQMLISEIEPKEVRLEIGWIFSNAANAGNPKTLINIYHTLKLMKIYLSFVQDSDSQLTEMGLSGVSNLLKIGEIDKKERGLQNSLTMTDLVTNRGIDILEQAQLHKSTKIYEEACKILKAYFEMEDPLS